VTRYYFLSEGCCLKAAVLFVWDGRPLTREDGSAVCSAITQWSWSLRARKHNLLSHLRLPQPGGPGTLYSNTYSWLYIYSQEYVLLQYYTSGHTSYSSIDTSGHASYSSITLPVTHRTSLFTLPVAHHTPVCTLPVTRR
jgi:hypothetical protein